MSRKTLNVPLAGTLAALCLSGSAHAMYQLEDRGILDDGSTVYAGPTTATQLYQEIDYEMYSNCYGICTSGREYADPDAIVFANEGETPDAANTTEPGGVQVDPAAGSTAGQPFSKTFHKDESFGNSTFGAGYVIDAALNATPATSTAGAKLDAFAEGKIWGQAFGSGRKDLARARASASVQQAPSVSAQVGVYVMGSQIYTKQFSAAPLTNSATLYEDQWFNRSFFSMEKRFTILFIPVKVTAAINGNAGIKVTGSIAPTVAKMVADPKGGAYVTASAAADIWVASIGVEGNLTLVTASLPVNAQLVATGCNTLGWSLKSDFTVNTLAGNLKAFVKIKLFFIKKKGSVTIARWSGYTKSWNLTNLTGSVPLYFTCISGAPQGGTGTLDPTGGTTGGGSTGGGGGGGGGGGYGGCLAGPRGAGSSESIIMVDCQMQ